MRLIGVRIPKNKGSKIALLIILAVIIGAVVFVMTMFKVDVKADANGIVAKSTLEPTLTIKYDDMKKAEIRNNLDIGSKKSGTSTSSVAAGTFNNKEFGKYDIYANPKCDEYIVITLKDNKIVVINGADPAATKAMFDMIHNNI